MTGVRPACRRLFLSMMGEFLPEFVQEKRALGPRGNLAFDHRLAEDLRFRINYNGLPHHDGFAVEVGWLRAPDGYWSTAFYVEPFEEGVGVRIQDFARRARI